jgi:membrane protease YdiL (CAAX protease family)
MVDHAKSSATIIDAVIILLSIAFVFLFPHFGFLPIPFYYVIPVLIIVWLVLRRTKENFASLGFSMQGFEPKSIFLGAVAAVALFIFLNYAFFPLLKSILPLEPANLDDFKNLRHNMGWYIFLLAASFIVGGFYEELIFHGFIFTRLEKLFGSKAIWVCVIITNLIFGLYHFQLGTSGVLNAFLAGTAYHLFMIRFKRNLWYSIFFHTFFDWIGITFIYLGYW